MATPDTAEIFNELDNFLRNNSGPYKETHQELQRQRKDLTIDNWNNVLGEQGIYGVNPTPAAEEYIDLVQGYSPPPVEFPEVQLSQDQHDAVNEETRKDIVKHLSTEKEEKKIIPGETDALLDKLFHNLTNLALAEAEYQRKADQKTGKFTAEEIQVRSLLFASAYKSYRLTHVNDFSTGRTEVRSLVDEIFQPGMTLEEYANKFEGAAEEKTLENYVGLVNSYQLWADANKVSPLNPADPFIAMLPAEKVAQVAPNTAISRWLFAEKEIRELEEEEAKKAVGEEWENLPPKEQQDFIADAKKRLRERAEADADFDPVIKALLESVDKKKQKGIYSGYIEEATTVVDPSTIALGISDPERSLRASRYFSETEPERELLWKENRARLEQWQYFFDAMAYGVARVEDKGLRNNFEEVYSLYEEYPRTPDETNAVQVAKGLGITDYDSFVRVTQELFDAQVEDAKRLAPKAEADGWETGWSMPVIYEPLAQFTKAVRVPEQSAERPGYLNKANLDVLLPVGTEPAREIGVISELFSDYDDPKRRLAAELENEIQFNYKEKHEEWKDFLIQAMGSDDRSSVEKVLDSPALPTLTSTTMLGGASRKEIEIAEVQAQNAADEAIRLQELLGNTTDPKRREDLQKQLDEAIETRDRSTEYFLMLKEREGLPIFPDWFGFLSGAEVALIQKDFVYKDSLQDLEAKQEELTSEILENLNEGTYQTISNEDIDWDVFTADFWAKYSEGYDPTKTYRENDPFVQELVGLAAQGYYLNLSDTSKEEETLKIFFKQTANLYEVKNRLGRADEYLQDVLQYGQDPGKIAATPLAKQIELLGKKEDLLGLYIADTPLKDLPPELARFFGGEELGEGATVRDAVDNNKVDWEKLQQTSKAIVAGAGLQTFNRDFGELLQSVAFDSTVDLEAGTVTTKPGTGMFLFETVGTLAETGVAETDYALSLDDIYGMFGVPEGVVLGPSMADIQGGGWDSWMAEWRRRSSELRARGGGYQTPDGTPLHPMLWMFDNDLVGEELLQYIKDNYNAQLKGTGLLDVKPKISYDQLMKWTDEFIYAEYRGHYEASLPYLESADKLFGRELALAGTNILDHIPYAASGALVIPLPVFRNFPIPIGGIAGLEEHFELYAGDYYTPTRDLRLDTMERIMDGVTYLDSDFMIGQQQLARGFGISSGPIYNTYTSLGIAQAALMDHEGVFLKPFVTMPVRTATFGSRAVAGLPDSPKVKTFAGAVLFELDPLVGGYFIEKTGPVDPSGRTIGRDEAKYKEAIERVNSDPYFSSKSVPRIVLETTTSALAGYLIGGTPGAILGAAAFNPSTSRALFHLSGLISFKGTNIRVLDSYYREAGVEKLLSDNGYIYREEAKLRGENTYAQRINPDKKKKPQEFERSDLIEVIFNRFGINEVDVAIATQDISVANKRTVATLADALMRGDKEVVHLISNKIEQRRKELKEPLAGVFGMYIELQKTNGYKKAQKDLVAVASRIGDDVGNADFHLAFLTAAAYLTGQDPIKFFDSFRIDLLRGTNLDFEALRQAFPEGATLTDLLTALDTQLLFREEAYFKALGLYDFLDRTKVSIEEMYGVEKPIQIDDILKFIKDAEKYTFIDNYDVDFNTGVEFNPPSEKMKNYSRALVSFGDKYAHVYYKFEKGKVTLGEIHVVEPHKITSKEEDLAIRLRASKILTAEKMKEGISRFGWDVDDVFQQLKGELTLQKKEFDIGLRRYFDNFASKKAREEKLKSKPKKIQRSATIGREVMGSYFEHLNELQAEEAIRTGNPRSKGKTEYVQTPADLPVHPNIKQQELNQQIIAEGMISQAEIVLESKRLLEDTEGVSANSYVEQINKAKDEKELLAYLGKNSRIFDYEELQKDIATKGFEAVKKELTPTKVEGIIRKKRRKAAADIKQATGRVETAMEIVETVDPDLHTDILEADILSFDAKWSNAFDKMNKAGIDLMQDRPRVTKKSKFYRGRSKNEIIMVNGDSQLLFRQAEVNNQRIMFLDAVNTPSSSGIFNISSIYAEIELAKLIRNKEVREKTIKELRSKLSSAREQLAINPPTELNDLFGDARLALRELLQSEDAPDYIGYQSDNLAYGSKIRSELKRAGIEFEEFLIKDPDGVPFRIIALTEMVQKKLLTEGLPVIPTFLDPNLSSLGLDIDNLLEADFLTENPLAGGPIKKWLGLPENADADALEAKLSENRQQVSTIHEDRYAGFSRQEVEARLAEGTLPEEVALAVQRYLESEPTTNNYAFVKGGKEDSFSARVEGNEIHIYGDDELNDVQIRNIVFEATKDGRDAITFSSFGSPTAKDTLNSLAESFASEVIEDGPSLKLVINEQMRDAAPARLTPLFAKKIDKREEILLLYGNEPTTLYHTSAEEKGATAHANEKTSGGIYRPGFFAEDVVIYEKEGVWRIRDITEGTKRSRRAKFDSKQEAMDQVKKERLVDPNERNKEGVVPIVKTVDETIKILHQEVLPHLVVHTSDGKLRRFAAAKKTNRLDSRTIEVDPNEAYLNGSTLVVNHANGLFASLSEIEFFSNSGAKELILTTPTKRITISGKVTDTEAAFFDLAELLETDFEDLPSADAQKVEEFFERVLAEIPDEVVEQFAEVTLLMERFQEILAEELRATGLDVTIEEHNFENTRGTYVSRVKRQRTGSIHLDYQLESEGYSAVTGKTEAETLKRDKLASTAGEEQARIILANRDATLSKIRRAYRTKLVRDYSFAGVEHLEQLLGMDAWEGVPDFIGAIKDNISINLKKFRGGKLTYRDTLVAYFTSVMSQQAMEMPIEELQGILSERGQLDALNALLGQHITSSSGVNFLFVDKNNKVRMEDIAGAWFITPKGQQFLKNFEEQCHLAKQIRVQPSVKSKKTILRTDAEKMGWSNTSPDKRISLDEDQVADLILYQASSGKKSDKRISEDQIDIDSPIYSQLISIQQEQQARYGRKEPAPEDLVDVYYLAPAKGREAQLKAMKALGAEQLRLSEEIQDLYHIRSAHPTSSNNLMLYWDRDAEIPYELTPKQQEKFDSLTAEIKEAKARKLREKVYSLQEALDELVGKAKLKAATFQTIDTITLMNDIIRTTDRLNSLGKRYPDQWLRLKKGEFPEEFVEPHESYYAQEVHQTARILRGIGEVKAPFLMQQLGFGVMVTADAQEVMALLGYVPTGGKQSPIATRNRKIRAKINKFGEAGTRGKTLEGKTIDQIYQEAIMDNFEDLRDSMEEIGIHLPDENWVAIVHQVVWSHMKKYDEQEMPQNAMYAAFRDIDGLIGVKEFNFYLQQMAVGPVGLRRALTQITASLLMDPNNLMPQQIAVLKNVLEKLQKVDDLAKEFLEFLSREDIIAGREIPELPVDYDIETAGYTRVGVSEYVKALPEAEQDQLLIDRGLTQRKDTGIAGSFINTGEVLKIRLGKLADLETFFHEHGHLVRHLLSPEMYDQVARRFDHIVVHRKARLTRTGEEQFAEAWQHTQKNELNSADPIIRRAMDVTKTNLQQVLLLAERSRIGRGAQGPIPQGMKAMFAALNPFKLLNREVREIVKPILEENVAEAHKKLEGVISLDAIEGLAKATAEGPIPFKQAFLKTGEVMQKDGVGRVEEESKVQRAQTKLVQRVYKTSADELLRDLRPSRYPSTRYENKLGPERQRAKENIAERTGRSVEEIEDVEVTTEEIDIAFLNLVNEGKPIDLLDFYARIETYADFRHVQANTNFNYQALTQRTIVRAEDREEYSARARLKMEGIFGESMEQVAERFGVEGEYDGKPIRQIVRDIADKIKGKRRPREGQYDPIGDISGMTRDQQKKLDRPYVMFGPEVKARLSHFVDICHSIPGGALLDGDFVRRVKDSTDPRVKIYITDITETIRDAIIDNAAPIAARRSRSLEAGSITPAYEICKFLDGLIQNITKKDRKIVRQLPELLGLAPVIFEDYNPTISALLPKELREKDLDPRILEVLNNLQAGLRALPQEIEMLLNLLQQENTLKAIEQAEKIFGPQMTDAKRKDLKAIGVSMMELSRRLQRVFSPPVDPVRIPQLRNIVNRIQGIKAGMISRDFELLLDAEDASLKVETMMQALQNAGEPMTEPYKLIREYLKKDKNQKTEMSKKELDALESAQVQMKQRYLEIASTREVLSLQTWKEGFLVEVRSILGPEITLLEENASIDLGKFLDGYSKDQLLTPEETQSATENISILLTALERKDHQVRRRGEQFFMSVTGKRGIPAIVTPEDAYHAYTMFYTGKIAMGDMDLKRMQGPVKFTLNEPPNKTKWTHHNLIEIYKQFGFREGHNNQADANLNARADIEKRFNIKDIEKLSEEEIVRYANEVARMPPQDKGFFRNTLIGMAFDRGDVKLSQTPHMDLGMVMLEMIVRLMAEEKLAEAASQIAEIHVYGDLQKVARDKMIELGFEPLKEEEVFINRVAGYVEEWVNQAPEAKLRLDGGLLVHRYKPSPEPSILAAQQVAAEIISTYGLEPGSKRKMSRWTSPDGVEYILPEGIEKILEGIEDQVAPVGVASDKTLISPQEIFERKANTRRLQQNLARSEKIKEKMVELIIEDYPQLNNKDGREQLKFLVDTYIVEQNPDSIKLREAMDQIDEIKEAEIAALLDAPLGKAAREYLKTTMERPYHERLPVLGNLLLSIKKQFNLSEEITFQLNVKQELAEAELTSEYIKTRREQREAEGVEEKYLPTAAAERLTEKFEPAKPAGTFVKDFFSIASYLPRRIFSPKRFAEGLLGGRGEFALNFVEAWMRMKKRLVTTGFTIGTAAYYINNMFGALFQGYLEGGISGLSSNFATAVLNGPVFFQGMAYLYPSELGGLGRRGNRNSKVFVSRDGRVWTAETLANEAQKHGIGGAFITTELAQSVVEDLRLKNPEGLYKAYALGAGYLDLWTDLAAATDNIFRFSMFMDEINKGASGAEAAKKVRDAYYDYAALTDFEKRILRQVFLFYAYMRKNQIQVVRALRDNPSRVMGTLRFIRNSQREAVSEDERGYNYRKLPDYLRGRILSSGGRMDFQDPHDVWYYEDMYGQKIHIWPMVGVADAAMMVGPLLEGVIKTFQADGLERKIATILEHTGASVGYFAGQASPPFQMIFELLRSKKIFGDIDLSRIRVSQQQIELINQLTGNRMFNTPGDDPLTTGGFINMVQSTYGYTDSVRGPDIYYYPENELDVLKFYFTLEILASTPVTNMIFGRPQKQTLYLLRNILGRDSDLPLGFTEWEAFLGILSRPTKALRTEDAVDQKTIRKLNTDIEKEIDQLQNQQ